MEQQQGWLFKKHLNNKASKLVLKLWNMWQVCWKAGCQSSHQGPLRLKSNGD